MASENSVEWHHFTSDITCWGTEEEASPDSAVSHTDDGTFV